MAIYESHQEEPWFSLLVSKKKSIEARLRKGKYSRMKPGDFIVVYSSDEKNFIKAKIIAVRYYDSFKDMLSNEDMGKILPGVRNIETGIEVYHKLYSQEDEKNYGIAAIEVELMD